MRQGLSPIVTWLPGFREWQVLRSGENGGQEGSQLI